MGSQDLAGVGLCVIHAERIIKVAIKVIKENKCTCKSCGKVWYYGKQEKMEALSASMNNLGKSMMCCSGCVPALLIPNKKASNLKQCPRCNSKNVTIEEVEHNVE